MDEDSPFKLNLAAAISESPPQKEVNHESSRHIKSRKTDSALREWEGRYTASWVREPRDWIEPFF